MSKLLTSFHLKGITLKNRVVMSPMCQYSAEDGFANDWHFIHYGSRAVGGCGAIIQEATAISPEGRITYGDLGIWKDEHIDQLSKIVNFVQKHGAVAGIQLAHAGRKASCSLPQNGGKQLNEGANSWTTVSASPIPFDKGENTPKPLSREDIKGVIDDFKSATMRSLKAGYEIIEIHAAHGYLVHQFLSPLSNHRTDEYGGSFENRTRFLLEIVDALIGLLGEKESLWVRISATDWVEGGWSIEESVELSKLLKDKGVDVIDVSSGGNAVHAKIPVGPSYQVPFSKRIKREVGVITGAVGLITDSKQAENLLNARKCDLIFLGRELLRNPQFVLNAAKELGDTVANYPVQYLRGYK